MTKNASHLFEILREWRNKLAQQNNVEPFMVLHNSVLEEIAEKKPTTLEDLAKIKGMGKRRIDKYGQFLFKIVNDKSTDNPDKSAKDKIFKVGEFIDFLNSVLVPRKSIIQGEVGEVKPRNGYSFFTLLDKDEDAVLNCFAWQRVFDNLGVNLKEGSEIQVAGFPKVFKRRGSFNFEVQHIGLVGKGALKQAFEALKKRLAVEGYFAPERKKRIPKYAQKIGLITSAFADAKTDFLTHLGKFAFKVYFYDARVEGLYAIDDIVSAIRWFNENMLDIEVLVLTRGGGSLESLQPFNSEAMARAIFGSKIPVITGIGHENDETIADLVADFFASTPTDAARVISDNWRNAASLISSYKSNIVSIFIRKCANIEEKLFSWQNFFTSILDKTLKSKKQNLDNLKTRLTSSFQEILNTIKSEENKFFNNLGKLWQEILSAKFQLNTTENNFERTTNRWLKSQFSLVSGIKERLKLANPTSRLKQGYSIIFDKGKKVIKSAKQLRVGKKLKLKFYEGGADSRVEKVYY